MAEELKLFNTLTRKKEVFKSIKKGEVGMYVCGPTVNDVPHLGHARQQVTFDILRKYFKFIGYKVKFVSNITDIEDKIIKKANELNEDIKKLTERNIKVHKEDYEHLGIQIPDIQPKATEYVRQMIELVQLLEKKGYTYKIIDDGIYYNVKKFKKYGKLAHLDIKKQKGKSRVSIKENKKSKEDFVLWKFRKPDEPEWNSPWGKGRPGWHIECSAMSHSILGLPFDIHGGGQDLIFPHHEDEIAQSEAAYGKKVANYWVHNGMINVNKVKMSKSLGNFTTIRDLLKNYPGKAIRYFMFLTHYRNPIDFSAENLDSAKIAYERLKRKILELKKEEHKGKDKTEEYEKQFKEAINDDLNMPKAIQILWKIVDDYEFETKKKLQLIKKLDSVLSLDISDIKEQRVQIPPEVRKILAEREILRKEKKWAEADILRERIKELGFIIQDTEKGQKLEKI